MPEMTAVRRSVVSDGVFAQLIHRILVGEFAPGDALPAERELTEVFEVNRHAVREAIKRLQQAGVVRVAQGGKTQVLDWRRHAGLELLLELARTGAIDKVAVLRDIVVMRRTIGADAARRCARLADDAALERVAVAARSYPPGGAGPDELHAADVAFWDAVVDGSGNLAYRLALNTLVDGVNRVGAAAIAGLSAEHADRAKHDLLAARLAARDEEGSYRAAWDVLGTVVEALEAL
ncbi:FadR/GntR family transcriptional regulator [Actinomadura flavalba]|uniref:FadR/GntR family transcriptional regulator n=1 Tax=Actinomadura flavalba TaxID=1120938 RepID=UPI00047777E4|nr:GntR family transcriptional regulator [Actinomadura flavalba]